ncbi:hypothetical protein Ani05nite_10660 [Amorphoplanes nipponensis]|uniref:EcsC protein family protein n=1 Tax=Actinoplanes nipponensis TaxID=135950 RepID=A0A919JEI2_9ACTN|nr:hypothetical protein [Actinoplanes nipponensis]GIE47532.1 hypothetical protein Ani05nite_10660 [Actinoplanes nipponensis]
MSRPDDSSAPSEDPGRELIKVDPAGAAGDEDAGIGATVAALTADDLEPAGRRRLLGRLVGDVRRRGLGQLFRPRAALRWMADVVADVAPHVPVRDRATLRRHFDGLDGDALAERLVRNAALATAGVGAAGGGVASLEWVATPTLLSAPVLLAAETVAVVAVELKLIGELHEVYGRPVTGNPVERASALVQSWAGQRGVNPLVPGIGVATVLGTAARKELQGTLLRRFGRNLTTMGPLLTGAAVASYLNRRATRGLGEKLIKDLRRQGPAVIDGDTRRELSS